MAENYEDVESRTLPYPRGLGAQSSEFESRKIVCIGRARHCRNDSGSSMVILAASFAELFLCRTYDISRTRDLSQIAMSNTYHTTQSFYFMTTLFIDVMLLLIQVRLSRNGVL